MTSVDALAHRAADTVGTFSRRAGRLAISVAVFVAFVALIAYAIGRVALSGDARSTWTLVGAVLLVIAVGAPLLAWWRLNTVRRHASELVGEVRRLIDGNAEAERVVIETVETGDPMASRAGGTVETRALISTQSFQRLRTVAVSTGDLRRLPRAMVAVTSFPALLALGLVMSFVFGVLGFVFLLVWIF